jgi:predicted secreted protein
MYIGMLIATLALESLAFGPSAVWHPGPDFRAKVLTACEGRGSSLTQCFGEQMKATGASEQAVRFAQVLHNDGYMSDFRSVGPIGVAAVAYPFRANENNGLYLVNGDPAAIDVDDIQRLPTAEIKKRYSEGTLWPGERMSPNGVLALVFADGSQSFVVDYRVQKGCHACALLARAFFSFRFDSRGKFDGITLTGIISDPELARAENRKMLSVNSGTTFSIVLPANQTTGYSWSLAPATKREGLEYLRHKYHIPSGSAPGAPGQDFWTFQAKSAGESLLLFEYARPWEKKQPAATSLAVMVRVEATIPPGK